MSFILLGILNSQVTAGGLASSYDLLESSLMSGSTASVTFSSLGSYSAYKHLQIRYSLRNTTGNTDLNILVNGITTASYRRHELRSNGSALSSISSGDNSSWTLNIATGSNANASRYGMGIIDVLDFLNSSKNPSIRIFHGQADDSSGNRVVLMSGMYPSAQAWSSLQIKPASDNGYFAAGSRISLYGIKG